MCDHGTYLGSLLLNITADNSNNFLLQHLPIRGVKKILYTWLFAVDNSLLPAPTNIYIPRIFVNQRQNMVGAYMAAADDNIYNKPFVFCEYLLPHETAVSLPTDRITVRTTVDGGPVANTMYAYLQIQYFG